MKKRLCKEFREYLHDFDTLVITAIFVCIGIVGSVFVAYLPRSTSACALSQFMTSGTAPMKFLKFFTLWSFVTTIANIAMFFGWKCGNQDAENYLKKIGWYDLTNEEKKDTAEKLRNSGILS